MSDNSGKEPDQFQRFIPAVLVFSSLIVLVISTRSLTGYPERIGLSIFGMFQKGFSAIGSLVGGAATSIAELRRLRQDYALLLEKTKTYDRLERDYADIRSENERLNEQLGFSSQARYQRITARIIGKDPANLYSTITIDKGVGDGVRKNMPVVAWQNGIQGLVGRVIEAARGTSIVVPLYDITSYVAARLAKSRYEGLLIGQGSEDEPLILRYVRKRAKEETQIGDLVVSSGLESLYPPELALGRVKKIRSPEYQPSLEIDIEPILDFSRLEFLSVVMPEGEGDASNLNRNGSMPVKQ